MEPDRARRSGSRRGDALQHPNLAATFDPKPDVKTLNFQRLMDAEGIFIADLAKGNIGETSANLAGSLIVSNIFSTALSRADVPEDERLDFTLYIDEAHNFTTKELESLLSDARKYHLNLVLARQYLGQFENDESMRGVLSAIFGNVGTTVRFRVGTEDSEEMALRFHDGSREDLDRWRKTLPNQDNYEFTIRMPIDGAVGRPFGARTLKPVVT